MGCNRTRIVYPAAKESGKSMTFLVCKIRKGRECKKPVDVCKKCRKKHRCESWKKYEQPELK
uniref:Uncharacterized protein n=1 Tax=viral metagenome TaxID=1070528 RepID=A0A6H1ZL84_9ZZZZ